MGDMRIMLVDDNGDLRRGMRDYLARQEGMKVVAECPSGAEALEALGKVRIVLFKPMNSVYRFVFEERGFDRVNDPKVLKALALAISADMDHLRDNRCYSFSVRQDITAQGDKVYWYEYNILPYYKDTLTKAWYHQPEVEDGIIR